MFSKLKNLFSGKKETPKVETVIENAVEPKVEPVKPKKVRKKRVAKQPDTLLQKQQSEHDGEPYINIVKVEIDPNNINNGAFELDWNDKFVLNLIRAGYKIREDDTDQMIVDRWFQTVCRNIALELYEQQVADPEKRNDIRIVSTRDIGNGRSEVS